MKPRSTIDQTSARHQRIGRKALQADRISRALGIPQPSTLKRSWSFPTLNPRIVAITLIAIILTSGAAYTGVSAYMNKKAEAQKLVVAEQARQAKAKSDAADACRRKKAEQKADLIGKVTYDELYDYGACDK